MVRKKNKELEDFLADACVRAVAEARHTATFEDQTHNLSDSYGAAVYKDGVLLPNTIAYLSPEAEVAKKWIDGKFHYGHVEMMNYFMNYRPKAKGYSLVLIAAMPYYAVLEYGGGGLRNKYKVISGANSFMRDLAKEIDERFGTGGKFGGRRRQGTTLIRIEDK